MSNSVTSPGLGGPSSSSAERGEVSILVIEDSEPFRLLIEAALRESDYDLSFAASGQSGLDLAEEVDPDVVILDIGLPGVDGIEVCRRLRQFTDAYIIMVTGRTEETDRLVGLSVGADDYLAKPFSARELALRVEVMLRRPRLAGFRRASDPQTDNETRRIIGDLMIDTLAREVRLDGEEISLTKIEFDLLQTLSSNPEMVFTRELLLERVWGGDWMSGTHVVDVHLANLRKKIDSEDCRHIKTVRGVGYRLFPGVA